MYIFYMEDFLGYIPEKRMPVVCFQIDFNLPRKGEKIHHILNAFPEMLCYTFFTTLGLYSENQRGKHAAIDGEGNTLFADF